MLDVLTKMSHLFWEVDGASSSTSCQMFLGFFTLQSVLPSLQGTGTLVSKSVQAVWAKRPGCQRVFNPHYQTNVVFILGWSACWDWQTRPIPSSIWETKIPCKPLLHRQWTLSMICTNNKSQTFLHWLQPWSSFSEIYALWMLCDYNNVSCFRGWTPASSGSW